MCLQVHKNPSGAFQFVSGERMKKRLFAIPLMAVAAMCMVVLAACGGPSVEELIREDLTAEFNSVLEMDPAEFVSDVSASDAAAMQEMGVEPEEFAAAYLDGIDYSIGDITVDGDTATAQVVFTCKSMTTIMEAFEPLADDFLATADVSSMTQEEGMQKMGELIMQATTEAAPEDHDLEFTYTKDGNAWSIDQSAAEEEIFSAMM